MKTALILAAALALSAGPALAQQGTPPTPPANAQAHGAGPQGQGGQQTQNKQSQNQQSQNQEDTQGTRQTTNEIGNLVDRLSQSALRDRLALAVDTVQEACATDIEDYCGSVSAGEGSIASCMRENADQLGRRCRLALLRASRSIKRAVQSIADDCISGIKSQCGNSQNVNECVQQNTSLPQGCRTVVAVLTGVKERVAGALKGQPVYSADDKDVGQVVNAVRGPDGKLVAVQIEVGRALGLGNRVVTIDADAVQELGNRIKLRLNASGLGDLAGANDQDQNPNETQSQSGTQNQSGSQ
ncbi:MAG: PRC-barrel domain-containing protein [Rhodomicrobium sp.]